MIVPPLLLSLLGGRVKPFLFRALNSFAEIRFESSPGPSIILGNLPLYVARLIVLDLSFFLLPGFGFGFWLRLFAGLNLLCFLGGCLAPELGDSSIYFLRVNLG